MYRTSTHFLAEWLQDPQRRPLVIRGARQVGKTWIVRELASSHSRQLIELNFEKNPEYASLFASNDVKQIMLLIRALFGEIDPKKSILFLDEIQAAPALLAKLRWFSEDMPELPVIAAGSLLEFIIAQHTFSMPVGRIQYMYLEPLSFEEFLHAKNKPGLIQYIKTYQLNDAIPSAIHSECMNLFKEYIIIGGMPQAVSSWITQNSLIELSRIHNDLIATYRDDFNKYNGRLSVDRLHEIINAVPLFLGQKFMYSKVNSDIQTGALKQALDLLCKARVCHRVMGTAGNGVPLAAEIQEKYTKIIFLDVGLCSALLKLSFDQLSRIDEIDLINNGGIAEQVAGQLLRTIEPFFIDPALYYWHRSEKGSNSEIDYLIQHHNTVVPVEVKAGSTGSLKSLHLFMGIKKLSRAIRINADTPSKTLVNVKDHAGNPVSYTLISIPYYLLGQLPRILNENQN